MAESKTLPVVQFDAPGGANPVLRTGFSASGNAATQAARLDYGANCADLPELAGKGEALYLEETASLGAGKKAGAVPDLAQGEIVEISPGAWRWRVTRPAADKTSEELAADLATAKTAKVGATKAKEAAPSAAGYTHEIHESDDPHTYQIDYAAQQNMTSIGALFALGQENAHGGFWRSVANVNVEMTDAQCIAFFKAAAAHRTAMVRNMWTLIAATNAASDQTALDAVDAESGWPS